MKIIIGLIVLIIMATSSFAGDCKWDINDSGTLNLLDVSYTIDYLYRQGPAPDCGPSVTGLCGDVNDDGKLNLLDVSSTINHLYRGFPEPICGSFTDIDGNVYKTVMIGTQEWMAENLKVTHYRNGDAIPEVTENSEWWGLITGAYCAYNNDISNVATYGRMYNWYAVVDSRNIAPAGWHVPTDAEWQVLVDYLGDTAVAGGKMKEAGTTHWNIPNTGATNESGFSALPGGYRGSNGSFLNMGRYAHFWSSAEISSSDAWYRYLSYYYSEAYRNFFSKRDGFSVRCVKGDVPILTTTPVSEVTQTMAECGGTITSDCGAEVTARGICWSTNPIPTLANNKTIDGTGTGSFTSSLTGLTENTTYYVRAYATNSAGTGYGGEKTFKTSSYSGMVTDIDGNVYQTVTIGTQVWMAENLKVTHYRNGEAIPNVTDGTTWESLTTGAYCNYNNDINNAATYGRLYNWYAAVDSRNIAPEGWHVPSDAEWQTLVDYLGGNLVAGGKMKEAGTTHWLSPNTGATNESGFSGLPGGGRVAPGIYGNKGNYAYFWSATEEVELSGYAWLRSLDFDNSGISRYGHCMPWGYSVRCVKDAEENTVTDIDGNVYETVTIGNQVWMAENLKVTHYCNGDALPNVTVDATWQGLTIGAYCEYNNDINNVATYGRLYNGYAVADSRNIAPTGWHVPSDAEWKQLEMYLGMSQSEADDLAVRGTTEGGKMKEAGTTHWLNPNAGATNESGFSALPGGGRIYYGRYYNIAGYAVFWTSTANAGNFAWYRLLSYSHSGVYRHDDGKRAGNSVRCVKD
jgi:uncharacterized protein (TIGR02145 family)